MSLAIGIPQAIYLAWILVLLITVVRRHGTTATIDFDARPQVVATLLTVAVLYWGGFFG